MAATNRQATTFILDDRAIGRKLDAFRLYSQRLPYGANASRETGWPATTNWAQVMFGFEAGAWDPDTGVPPVAGEVAWAFVREGLQQLYDEPQKADGQLPPERAFLLGLMGLLETPQALLNRLPSQHLSLYYQQMLGLQAHGAQVDQLTVHFTLAEGVREQLLPDGLVVDAGQDSAGHVLHYALTQPLTVNAATVTDLRWVVRDPCVAGGRRGRVILDETAGQPWPQDGVRLFEASPARAGDAPRADADRAIGSGRIVESPLLAVAGGEREWTVTLKSACQGVLRAAVSIDDTWVALACSGKEKTWTITLPADGGVPTAPTMLEGWVSASPLLRLSRDDGDSVPAVEKLAVKVSGAVGVRCAGDDCTLLTEGGLPFGERADGGSGVNLMSPEWWRLGPKLQQITVTPTWAGLPEVSFPTWYGPDETQKHADWLLLDQDLNVVTDTTKGKKPAELTDFPEGTLAHRVTNGNTIGEKVPTDTGYPGKPQANRDFTVRAALVQQGQSPNWQDKQALFGGEGAPEAQPLTVTLVKKGVPVANTPIPDDDDPGRWPWRVRMELGNAFLHDEYAAHRQAPPQTLMFVTEQTSTSLVPDTEQVNGSTVYKMVDTGKVGPDGTTHIFLPAMKKDKASVVTPVPVTLPKAQWHAPYLPQWSGLRVDYTASDEQVVQRVITPFGHAPQDTSQPEVDAELYLGVKGIEADQTLTLHWQLHSPGPLPLEWQYLATGERWVRLPVNDDTDGWQTRGTWSVNWPGDACESATSLPAGRMWLRGRVRRLPPRDPQQVALATTPWLQGVVTNAAPARLLSPQDVQATHFTAGLPALRVTQALNAPDTLQSVTQPWPSWGGKPADTQAAFEARAARRLRHRERGLNNVDLMTLLQERYPAIRELTMLTPHRDEAGTLSQTMVVMPGPALSDSTDRRRPGLSPAHLADMAAGLQTGASPWLSLQCINPDYVTISVSWSVDYHPGLSRSVGNARVKAALEAAFMPWAGKDDDGSLQVTGRAVTHSAIRDVLRDLAAVSRINAVYLNGSETDAPLIFAGQVAVLNCIPLEYTCLRLAWPVSAEPEKGEDEQWFGEMILPGDGVSQATVQVSLPDKVEGLAPEAIPTKGAEVYLVDLDTGQRLPASPSEGAGLWATESMTVASWDRACYAESRTPPPSRGKHKFFNVSAASGTCGVHRLGVALVLKVDGVPDVTLQSAAVGEHVTLRVRSLAVATRWRDPRRWGLTRTDLRALAAPDGWSATLERHTYSMTDGEEQTALLRFKVPDPVSAESLAQATTFGVKGGGLRPVIDTLTPHGVVGGGSTDPEEVVLWYVNPPAQKVIGLDVGSSIGKASLDEVVSFTPAAASPQVLTLYALRLKTAANATKDVKIGEAVSAQAQTCSTHLCDVGLRGVRAVRQQWTLTAQTLSTSKTSPVEQTV
ncbi:hypothetical protein KH388_22245 [Serratia rubidaea]|nr:hypothetical protein [Serratia rubidaea]